MALLLLPLGASALAADESRDQGRDPLRPPTSERQQSQPRFDADAWKLASTLVSGERRLARVNGHTVRLGDRVGGAKVLAIHNGRVRLDYRGRQFTIHRSIPDIRREHGS